MSTVFDELAIALKERDEARYDVAQLESELNDERSKFRTAMTRALEAEAFIDGEVTASLFVKRVRRLAQRAIWWASDMWHSSEFETVKRQRDQSIINASALEADYKKFQRLYYENQRVLIDRENDELKARIAELEGLATIARNSDEAK